MCDITDIHEIYKRLQDDESKVIYIARLNYSMTQDVCFLKKMVDQTVKSKAAWQSFLKRRSSYGAMVFPMSGSSMQEALFIS